MRTMLTLAGICLVIGGCGQAWTSAARFRRGAPWRGMALSGIAAIVYGILALAGIIGSGTVVGDVLIWIVAVAIWAAWWLNRRDAPPAGVQKG